MCSLVGREEEWLCQNLYPWKGNLEEKGGCMGGNPPWGVSSSGHRLDAHVLGSYVGEISPLSWLEECWNRQNGCGKPGLCWWGASICWLAPRQGRERSALVVARFPMKALLRTPAWPEWKLWTCLLHITVQHCIWGTLNRGKDSTMGHRGNQVTG